MVDTLHRTHSDNLWYCILLLAQLSLVWQLPYFPTQDGPSHLYNAVILHDLLNGGKEWGEYYRYELKAAPNLGYNLIILPLLSFVKPLVAEKLFLSLYIAVMGLTVPYFIRTFAPEKPLTLQLLAVQVIFNYTLMMGFYSYCIAIPAFLLAFATAWSLRAKPFLLQFIFCNLTGIVIYFLHLIPFILYLISLSVIAITDSRGHPQPVRSFIYRIAMMLPLMLLCAWYIGGGESSANPLDFSYLLSQSRFNSLFDDLISFSSVYFSPLQYLSAYTSLFVAGVLSLLMAFNCIERRFCLDRGQQTLFFLISILTVLYFAAPFRFGGGSYFNDRFPWVLLIILIPLLACVSIKIETFTRTGLVFAGILSVATNAYIFRQHSADVSTFLSGIRSGCNKGEGLLLYRTSFPPSRPVDVLLHASSYYGVLNGCLNLGNYEIDLPYFPVRYRHAISPLPTVKMYAYALEKMDFSKYPAVSRVLGWDLNSDERLKMSGLFVSTFENDRLSIWKRR